jgi:hypothetical protein
MITTLVKVSNMKNCRPQLYVMVYSVLLPSCRSRASALTLNSLLLAGRLAASIAISVIFQFPSSTFRLSLPWLEGTSPKKKKKEKKNQLRKGASQPVGGFNTSTSLASMGINM